MRNPRTSGLQGRTVKIQAVYHGSKRPVFFELYILAFSMQQKTILLPTANLLLCHHILKSHCQRQKDLFSYLLFKSCHSVFVLLVQCLHLMLQSFLLVQNNNSMCKYYLTANHIFNISRKKIDSLLYIFRKT